jgi:hypothetical protein
MAACRQGAGGDQLRSVGRRTFGTCLENVNWNMGVRKMTDSGGLSWEAQEVLQKIKSFNRLPGAGIPLIQLNMRVGSAKTVKKGIPELKSAGLITDTASGEPTLTDKGYKTSV